MELIGDDLCLLTAFNIASLFKVFVVRTDFGMFFELPSTYQAVYLCFVVILAQNLLMFDVIHNQI